MYTLFTSLKPWLRAPGGSKAGDRRPPADRRLWGSRSGCLGHSPRAECRTGRRPGWCGTCWPRPRCSPPAPRRWSPGPRSPSPWGCRGRSWPRRPPPPTCPRRMWPYQGTLGPRRRRWRRRRSPRWLSWASSCAGRGAGPSQAAQACGAPSSGPGRPPWPPRWPRTRPCRSRPATSTLELHDDNCNPTFSQKLFCDLFIRWVLSWSNSSQVDEKNGSLKNPSLPRGTMSVECLSMMADCYTRKENTYYGKILDWFDQHL